MKTATCLCQVNNGIWCQESYETSSRDAGGRARQLRKIGYQVSTEGLGLQVTSSGSMKLSLVTIRPGNRSDTFFLPTENWILDRS